MLTRARSRMQDSLNRVVRDGVERLGAAERTSSEPSDDSNARSNSSPTLVPQARTRSSSRQLPPSVIDISVNSSSQADSHSISSNSHQSFITNYTRHSVESSISPISHPSKYSRALRNELVADYVQRFCQRYDLSPNDVAIVRLTDDLRLIYREYYLHGEDAVDVAMQDVYNACCQSRDSACDTNRIRGGAATSTAVEETKTEGELDEVDADNVDDRPTDRDARLLRRNQLREDAAGQGGHGDGNGDGSSGGFSGGAPGDNNGPAGRHNNDQEGQNDQPGAPPMPDGRNGGGGPPSDDDGGDGSDDDDDDDTYHEPEGFYLTRRLIIPGGSGITPDDIDYNDDLRMLRRAFWLCNIQDRNHAPLFVFGGLTTFEILSSYTIAKWTQFQKSAAKWQNCQLF